MKFLIASVMLALAGCASSPAPMGTGSVVTTTEPTFQEPMSAPVSDEQKDFEIRQSAEKKSALDRQIEWQLKFDECRKTNSATVCRKKLK
jgi:hypothetical protein